MTKEQMQRTFWFIWTGQIVGSLGHILFYWVQENTYGEQNFLKFLSDVLGRTVSATSYFVVLMITCLTLALLQSILKLFNHPMAGKLFVLSLVLVPFASGTVYTLYEIYQSQHPTYIDNYGLDIILGWLACLTVWLLAILSIKKA